ncbi:MAG: hypothetical protein NT150_09220 [Bacteroidetes bacterium]|nr:hypothetical protein [Bacteroidota bacterium]
MKRYYIIFCFLFNSVFSINAQSIEDGLVYFKWKLVGNVCDMKVSDTLKLLQSTEGIQFSRTMLGNVKLKELNGVNPCSVALKLFDIRLRVKDESDKLAFYYHMTIKMEGVTFYFRGEDCPRGICFVRIK